MSDREKYVSRVKRVQAFIAPYNYASFVGKAIEYLSNNIGDEDFRKQRWTVALAVKWSCLHSSGNRPVTRERFLDICNKIYALQVYAAEFDANRDSGLLALRPLFLNQYWYQRKNIDNLLYLSRCHHLMCKKTKAQNYLAKSFHQHTGVELENYFMMSYVLSKQLFILPASSFVNIDLSDVVFRLLPNIPLEEVISFVKFISLTIEELPTFFSQFEEKNYRTYEYFETTPLSYRPFIYTNGKLTSLSPKIALNGITELITDFFIKNDAKKFVKNYSCEYEDYIKGLFASVSIKFLAEKDIESFYRTNDLSGKSVDFIVGNDIPIFIDAKAIQPNNVSLLSSANRNLYRDKLKSSFLKGFWQIQESCNNFEKIRGQYESKFGLVVTHKDFYFVSAKRYQELIEPDLPTKVTNKFNGIPVPLENVFFVTIRDLEVLLTAFSTESELMAFLQSVTNAEANSEGRRLNFSHHIEDSIQDSTWMCHPTLKSFFNREAKEESRWLARSKAVWTGKETDLIKYTQIFKTKLESNS